MAGKSSGSLLRQFLRLVERRHARESDRELLRRYTAGRDEEAFAAVVARHGPMGLAQGRERLRRRLERRGFTLPAALAAALLAEGVAPAAVPVALVQTTVQAAAVVVAGGVLAAGVVSERVTSLSYGVLQTMFLTQ